MNPLAILAGALVGRLIDSGLTSQLEEQKGLIRILEGQVRRRYEVIVALESRVNALEKELTLYKPVPVDENPYGC